MLDIVCLSPKLEHMKFCCSAVWHFPSWDRPFSGMLRSLDWWLGTDVSGQPISLVFNGQRVRRKWNRHVVPKRRQVTTNQRCVSFQKISDLVLRRGGGLVSPISQVQKCQLLVSLTRSVMNVEIEAAINFFCTLGNIF